jgi:hypothetical protein
MKIEWKQKDMGNIEIATFVAITRKRKKASHFVGLSCVYLSPNKFSAMGFLKNLLSKFSGNSPAAKEHQGTNGGASVQEAIEPIITITEEELACSYPSKNIIDKITWKDINHVDVLTTEEGPIVCDVFILISDNNGGVVVPQDREECKVVIDKIFKLPGFGFNEFTAAMSSTSNKRFNVWRKN